MLCCARVSLFAPPRAALLAAAAMAAVPAPAPAADPPPPPSGLVLHFNLDQWEPGNAVTDRASKQHNGRATGVKWNSTGRQGGAAEFGEKGACIQVPPAAALTLPQATLAVWFKASQVQGEGRTIVEREPGSGFAWSIAGETPDAAQRGRLRVTLRGKSCHSDAAVDDGLWHHGVVTAGGGRLRLYVDGKPQAQSAETGGPFWAGAHELTLGMSRARPGPVEKCPSFDGTLDEFMVFSRVLSEAEIKTMHAAVPPRFTKSQVARRLAELKELRDRGLILPDFYERKVRECEAGQ